MSQIEAQVNALKDSSFYDESTIAILEQYVSCAALAAAAAPSSLLPRPPSSSRGLLAPAPPAAASLRQL